MKEITNSFGILYHPVSALVIYQSGRTESDTYAEHFDMDSNGNPVNAHPLTVREANILAKALNTDKEKSKAFLTPEGVLPTNVLYINPSQNGSVLWYSKSKKIKMFFTENLDIPNGVAEIPALLWYADRNKLIVFSLLSDRRPTEKTKLYYAPFFNVYENGNVCMGTINVNIKSSASVEGFTAAWESYFFNSYFSHLMQNHNPVKGNCVSLWKEIINTQKPFPKEVLKKTNRTLKNLLT